MVDASGLQRLPIMTANYGTLVELTSETMSDGPWCGASAWRFDADLYRVRQVQVTLRLQAESRAVRGRDAGRFTNAGDAREAGAEVTDLELRVDVSPRNLRLR